MTSLTLFCSLYALLVLALPCGAAERLGRDVKSDTLRFLTDLREENVSQMKAIDQTLTKKIEEGGDANLDSVPSLKTAQREHVLRQEFLNRLISQIDRNFNGGDLRGFLERALTEMAKIDAVSTTAETGLYKFMRYAADAVHRLPERKENILAFLEGYMNRSVANPIRPEDYLNSRNYTNGAKAEPGAPLGREDVGAFADRRLQEMTETPLDQQTR